MSSVYLVVGALVFNRDGNANRMYYAVYVAKTIVKNVAGMKKSE